MPNQREDPVKPQEWRVEFDAQVEFANGGGLQAQGFLLDVDGDTIDDRELGELFLRHLGLLMASVVRITNKRMVAAPHKGSRESLPHAEASETLGATRVVDLSHEISDGMVTYPGLPGPEIGEHLTRTGSRRLYDPGTEFSIGRISMVANTGTYLDSPFHRYEDGMDLAALPLESSVDLEGIVVRVTDAGRPAIGRKILVPLDVRGKAVLLHTGWDRHWATDRYGDGHPFLSAAAADWLVDQGAALVGIDSVNIDDTSGGARPAHSTLLAANIPIVEHLTNLGQLPPTGFRFHAAPAPVIGLGTWPVRAYALVS